MSFTPDHVTDPSHDGREALSAVLPPDAPKRYIVYGLCYVDRFHVPQARFSAGSQSLSRIACLLDRRRTRSADDLPMRCVWAFLSPAGTRLLALPQHRRRSTAG